MLHPPKALSYTNTHKQMHDVKWDNTILYYLFWQTIKSCRLYRQVKNAAEQLSWVKPPASCFRTREKEQTVLWKQAGSVFQLTSFQVSWALSSSSLLAMRVLESRNTIVNLGVINTNLKTSQLFFYTTHDIVLLLLKAVWVHASGCRCKAKTTIRVTIPALSG